MNAVIDYANLVRCEYELFVCPKKKKVKCLLAATPVKFIVLELVSKDIEVRLPNISGL